MKFFAISSIAFLFLNQVLAKPATGCLQVHTVTDNDNCYSVAQKFELTEGEFYAMNPGLHHSAQHMCDNLDTGKPYCVCMEAPCVFTASSKNMTIPHNTTIPSSKSLVLSSNTTATTTSVSHSHMVSPFATSTPFSSNSSSSSSSHSSHSPTARTSTSASPGIKSFQNSENTSSASTTKALGAFALGLTLASTSSLF